MARCKDLGRIADASYYSRRAQANGRCHLAKGHYRHAQFRSGADAARQALFGWGRGAHRATDRRERSESCRCRCSGSCRRVCGILRLWKTPTARPLLGNMFKASMAGTALFSVVDFPPAPDSWERPVRGAPAVGRLGLSDKLSRGGAKLRRKLRWTADELKRFRPPFRAKNRQFAVTDPRSNLHSPPGRASDTRLRPPQAPPR